MLRLFTILLCTLATAIALQEGDPCTITGQAGICQVQSTCSAYPTMKALGVQPLICGYDKGRKIICCPTLDPVGNNKKRKSEQCDTPFYAQGNIHRGGSLLETLQFQPVRTLHYGPVSLDLGAKRTAFVPSCDEYVPLILAGDDTKNGEFPHMAALGWFNAENSQYDFRCGGSLISDRYVLTAGHCVYGSNHHAVPDIVRLGDNILNSTDDELTGSDFKVKRAIKHPEYRPSKGRYNDIALIELNQTVDFNLTIRPACLWPSETLNISKAIAAGYGATENSIDPINTLLKVELDLLGADDCKLHHPKQKRLLPRSIIESQLCAYDPEGRKDTCQGDSGGPLQVILDGHKCLHYIIGVTSFGNYCGGITPAIYSKVQAYLDWIESVVWP